jgi:sarcosine oxidase
VVERNVLYWFEPQASVNELRRLPLYTWEDRGAHAYGTPYIEGQGVKSAFHHSFGEITTAESIRRDASDDEKTRMKDHLARFLPAAAGTLREAVACMYTNTPDYHFVIDRHPAHADVTLACGFSGHGFKFCSVVGEILADLALQGETAQPIGLFALRRFSSPVI